MLAKPYSWFTEGFDTADLKDAKALLDELAGSIHKGLSSRRRRSLGRFGEAKCPLSQLVAGAHCLLGRTASWLGELEAAREHLELAV